MACHSGAIFIAVTLCVCFSIANTIAAMYGSHWAEIEVYNSNGDKSYNVSSFFPQTQENSPISVSETFRNAHF